MITNFSLKLIALLITTITGTSAQLGSIVPPAEAVPPIILTLNPNAILPTVASRPLNAVLPPILNTEITPSTVAIPSTAGPLVTAAPVTIATLPPTAAPTPSAEANRSSNQCLTPIGKNGLCMNLLQCPSLFNLLKTTPLLEEDKLYLKSSQCGLRNRTVLVCCPDQLPSAAAAAPIPVNSTKLALLPQPGKCGNMLTNRLYGGYNTELDAYAWMALLEYSKGVNDTGHHCGGTLINDRYILTAAHCVTALPETWSLIRVRLGEWDRANAIDCEKFGDFEDCADSHIDIPIERIIPHEGYVPTSRNKLHDIALIRLAISINSTDFIHPICLPLGESLRHAFDGQSLDLVGWGVNPQGSWSNVKERSSAPVVELSYCRQRYAEFSVELESSQFCVEGRVKNETCRIDSGGPVISFDTSNKGLGSFYVTGIQSFVPTPCWTEGWPGVYTRVGEYIDWILDKIQP